MYKRQIEVQNETLQKWVANIYFRRHTIWCIFGINDIYQRRLYYLQHAVFQQNEQHDIVTDFSRHGNNSNCCFYNGS